MASARSDLDTTAGVFGSAFAVAGVGKGGWWAILIPVERFGTGVSIGRFFGIGLLVLSGSFISLTRSLGAPSGYSTMSSRASRCRGGSSGGLSPTERAGVGAIAVGGAFGGACICTSWLPTPWTSAPSTSTNNWSPIICFHAMGVIGLTFLATKRFKTNSPSIRNAPWTTGPVSKPECTKHASMLLVSFGDCTRRLSGNSANTVEPNIAKLGFDNFRCVEYSRGEKSDPCAFEKWLWLNAIYVQTSDKPRAEKFTSAPPSFISARRTANDSFNLLTARSAPPLDWCCWGRARRTMNVYFSELVPTNSETALSASVCNTTELVEDDNPKWSASVAVATTYPMQLVANSVRTKILMVPSDSSSTTSPRVVTNAKSACTSVSNVPSFLRRWWKVDFPRAQIVHLGS